jgi:hypothetical protein
MTACSGSPGFGADLSALAMLGDDLSGLAQQLLQDDGSGWRLAEDTAGDQRVADAVDDFAASWRVARQEIVTTLRNSASHLSDICLAYHDTDGSTATTMAGLDDSRRRPMTDNWTLLDGNPTPGDPDEIIELSGRFRMVSATGASVHETIDTVWSGTTTDQLVTTRPDLRQLAASFQDAAAALEVYATALGEAQTQAATALVDAEQASADIAAAETRQRLAATEQQAHQQTVDAGQYDADEVWARLAIEGRTLDPTTQATLQRQLEQHEMNAARAADDAAHAGQQAAVAHAEATAARSRLANAKAVARQAGEHRAAAVSVVVAALGRAEAAGARTPNLLRQRTGVAAPQGRIAACATPTRTTTVIGRH